MSVFVQKKTQLGACSHPTCSHPTGRSTVPYWCTIDVRTPWARHGVPTGPPGPRRDPTAARRTGGGTVGPRFIGASPVWAAGWPWDPEEADGWPWWQPSHSGWYRLVWSGQPAQPLKGPGQPCQRGVGQAPIFLCRTLSDLDYPGLGSVTCDVSSRWVLTTVQ